MTPAYDADERFALAELGHALYDEGRLADARALWEGLAALSPADERAFRMLALIALREARFPDAVALASTALERQASPAVALVRAEALLKLGRLGEALRDLEWLAQAAGQAALEPVRRRAIALAVRLRRPLRADAAPGSRQNSRPPPRAM